MDPASVWSTVALAAHGALVIAAFVFVPINRKPSSATAWLLLITVAPFVGIILFLLVGSPKLPERRRKLQRQMTTRIAGLLSKGSDDPDWGTLNPAAMDPLFAPHATLAAELGGMAPMRGNAVAMLHGYDGIIAAMVEDIEQARHYVHVEFYIIAMDAATEPLLAALERAVKRGVTVRLLLDQMGSRKFPHRKALEKRLTAAGIAWRYMLPLFDLKELLRPDLRNHRKILIVDSVVAYTGSMNLITKGYHRTDALYYEELCVRASGPIVFEFEAVFVTDWYSETGELLAEAAHPRVDPVSEAPDGGMLAQVLPSGSGFDNENNLRLFTGLVHAARSNLLIATPYFVPDEALLLAVTSAAQRGVAVTLINSAAVDQPMVVGAQRSYYEELLRAGVDVRLYRAPVLLHAKTMVVDDDLAVVGSSNMDLRSFTLNMEVSLILYGADAVQPLRTVVEAYAASSDPQRLQDWRERPLGKRLIENLARLTAALQ